MPTSALIAAVSYWADVGTGPYDLSFIMVC